MTKNTALQTAWLALVGLMPDPVISIKAGKSGHFNTCDLRKVDPAVGLELLRQGAVKPLTDISKDRAKDETDTDLHRRRAAKIENWYNGDFSVRGGGVADPVATQMRVEICAVYQKNGADPKSEAYKEATKGTAAQILARAYPDPKQYAAAMDHFRSIAQKVIDQRNASKVDISKIDLLASVK